MSLLHSGSLFGESPHYVSPANHSHASSLKELLATSNGDNRAIDVEGFRQYFVRRPDGSRTCFQSIEKLPAGCDLHLSDEQFNVRRRDLPMRDGPLLPLLEERIAALLAGARNVAIALSGGLDSALVLAIVRRVTGRSVPILTLATGLPGYCELTDTLETARVLNAGDVDVIQVRAEQLIAALPEAIAACETPLFNLHPVTKLLLAQAAAQRGYDAILTGDGADQMFAGSDARNYLPIVGALVRSKGISLLSPFFDETIAGWAARQPIDAGKTALRNAAAQILPSEIAWRKKTARLAPDFILDGYRDRQFETQLARRLQSSPPAEGAGPEQTLWATSTLLLRQLGGIP